MNTPASSASSFETQVVKNTTRRVFFWLTIISVAFTTLWVVAFVITVNHGVELDARCKKLNVFDDGWAEACEDATAYARLALLAIILAGASLLLAVGSLIVFFTRDRYKERIVPCV